MEHLDINLKFFCRSSHQNSKGQFPIVLRISFRNQVRDIFTGLSCLKQDWDKTSATVLKSDKSAKAINNNLELIRRKANHVFDQLRFSGEFFSIDDFVGKLKGKEQKPQLLIDFMEESNKKMLKRVRVEITKATYYKYKITAVYIREFLLENYKVNNYHLLKINVAFLDGYFRFLKIEKKVSHNTAIKYMSFLKVMLSPAISSGIIKSDPFRQLKLKAKHVYREFLSQEEISKIENLILDNEDLQRKKDIFLFACYTGLAYTDLKQLSPHHIIHEADGSNYILKPRQKTGQESIIPLLPSARRILLKYSITGKLSDFNWFISSNQKMNLGLKYIGQKAGISKVLHMHLARHTFATTVTLANGVPIETVSKMLGHATIRQTQHYAKVQI
jgi:site-specific recombinase XerD